MAIVNNNKMADIFREKQFQKINFSEDLQLTTIFVYKKSLKENYNFFYASRECID